MIDKLQNHTRNCCCIPLLQFSHNHLESIENLIVEIPENNIILEIGNYEVSNKIFESEEGRFMSFFERNDDMIRVKMFPQ